MTCTPHNDEPDIDINLLPERQRLLAKLVQDIRKCPPPMVFGVHGDWGAGKTSFLQAVMYALTGKCPRQSELKAEDQLAKDNPTERQKQLAEWHENPPHAVWFEAWRYQNETAPVVALLHQLRESLTWWETPAAKLKESASAGWSIMRKNLLLALDSITLQIEGEAKVPLVANGKVGAGFSPFHLSKARQESAAERHSTPLPSNQIRDALDNILANLLGNGSDKEMPAPDQRVVIFIDDLDRCAATAMFTLLESIKIYLNLRHCVFVLGINRHEVERGIISVLPEAPSEDQRQVRSHEYIEKLCGNIVRLPYPGPEAQKRMLRAWLHLETSQKDNEFLEKVAELAAQYGVLPQNPRRIKMWCNTILLMYEHRVKQIGPPQPNGVYPAPDTSEAAALVLMGCLYTFYPVLHQSLASSPSFLVALKRWCDAENRFDPDLAVFEGVARIFVRPSFITTPGKLEQEAYVDVQRNKSIRDHAINKFEAARTDRLNSLEPILKRAYGWSEEAREAIDSEAEAPHRAIIPLLTDPSTLSYFHPQRLVAEESITEAQIKPYLHLD